MGLCILIVGLEPSCAQEILDFPSCSEEAAVRLVTMRDACQALDFLSFQSVDLLIADAYMTDGEGRSMTQAVEERCPACKVLLLNRPRVTDSIPLTHANASTPHRSASGNAQRPDLHEASKPTLINLIQKDALLADIRDGYRIPEPVADRLFETRKRYEAVLYDYGFSHPNDGRLYLILNCGAKGSLGNEEIRAVGLLMRQHLGDRMVHHIACLSQGGELDWFVQTTKDCTQSDINGMMVSIRTLLDSLWGWQLYFAISAPLKHADDLYAMRQRMRRALTEMCAMDEQFVRSFPDNRLSAGLGDGVVESVKAYLESKLRQDVSLAELSGLFGYHPDYLSRIFRNSVGMTMIEYHARKRMELVASMLRDPTMPISDIACEMGFSSVYHFSRAVRKHLGLSPTAYRRQSFAETQQDITDAQPENAEIDALNDALPPEAAVCTDETDYNVM